MDERKALEQQYDEIMKNTSLKTLPESSGTWEKTGDIYKKFSLYDTSGYSTSTESSLVDVAL